MFGEGEMMSDASAATPIIYNEDGQPVAQAEGAASSGPAPSSSPAPSSGAAVQGQKGRRGDTVEAFVKNADKSERKISEIRVFFDDGTYEVYLTFKS